MCELSIARCRCSDLSLCLSISLELQDTSRLQVSQLGRTLAHGGSPAPQTLWGTHALPVGAHLGSHSGASPWGCVFAFIHGAGNQKQKMLRTFFVSRLLETAEWQQFP